MVTSAIGKIDSLRVSSAALVRFLSLALSVRGLKNVETPMVISSNLEDSTK